MCVWLFPEWRFAPPRLYEYPEVPEYKPGDGLKNFHPFKEAKFYQHDFLTYKPEEYVYKK